MMNDLNFCLKGCSTTPDAMPDTKGRLTTALNGSASSNRAANVSRHVRVCIRQRKDFHKHWECPLRTHICYDCGAVQTSERCKKCLRVQRQENRDAKNVYLEPQIGIPFTFSHEIGNDTITAVQDMLSDFTTGLTHTVPMAARELYDDVRDRIRQDLGLGNIQPETLVNVTSSVLLLMRTMFKNCGKGNSKKKVDWINVGLVITQFLSTYGVFGSCVQWIVDKFTAIGRQLRLQYGGFPDNEGYIDGPNEQVFLNAHAGAATTILQDSLMSTIIAGVLSLVHLIVFKDKPNWSGLVTFVTNTSRIPLITRGFSSLFEGCAEAGHLAKSWIMKSWLGADVEEVEEAIEPYTQWCDAVDRLYRSASRRDFVWALDDLNEFDRLYDDSLNIRKDRPWLNRDRALMTTYTTRMAMLVKLQDEVNNQNVRQRTRLEPFLVNFWGESSVGKSLMVPSVVINYMANFHPEEFRQLKFDHNACVYTRKSGDARWDGVGKQRIIVYDDFMQVKDSANAPSTELFEMIELSNSAPFNPLMAQLEKKGKVRLEPELVLLTSNVMKPDIKSLEKPAAVYRRFDMIWEVLPHPQVVKNGVFDKDKMWLRHSTDICGCGAPHEPICMKANQFQRWKVEQYKNNEQVDCRFERFGEPVTRDEMMACFEKEIDEHRCKTSGKLDFFQRMARQLVEEPTTLDEVTQRVAPTGIDEFHDATEVIMEAQTNVDGVSRLTRRTTPRTLEDAPCSSSSVPVDQIGFIDDDFEETEEEARLPGSLTRLRELSGDLFGGVREVKTWMQIKVEALIEKAKAFVTNHPVITAFSTVALALGVFVGIKGFMDQDATHSDTDTEEPIDKREGAKAWVAENDDSMSAKSARPRNKNTWRPETDDSQKKMETRRKGQTSWRPENDDSQKKMESRRKGQKTFRAENDVMGRSGSGLSCKAMKEMFADMDEPHVEVAAQGVSDPNLLPIMQKAYRQMYIMEDMEGCRLGSAIAIRGRILLTFRHCFSFLQDKTFRLRNLQTGVQYEMHGIDKHIECGDAGDLMLMQGPRMLPQSADITRHIISDFVACNKTNLNVRLMVPGRDVTTILVGHAKAQDTVIRYSVEDGDVVLRDHYMYKFDTERGFCGSLLFQSDKGDACKIIGMHVCGSSEASVGLSSALCREAINEALLNFDLEAQCSLPLDAYDGDMSVPGRDLEALGYCGKAPKGISDQDFTKIKRSPLYGWEGSPIKEPVQLSGTWQGEDVKEVARRKLKSDGFKLKNEMSLDLAKKTVGHNIKKSSDIRPRLWSLEEAAFGGDEKYCDSVDLTTSCGVPWKWFKPKKPGKKGFLKKGQDGNHWIRHDMRIAVQERIERATRNERTATVWSDHYKDEIRLIDKTHKPRLFVGAPLDYTLAVRMYFGQWCAATMDGRIQNEIAVGINPHGDEWSVLAFWLKSDHMMCGDFQKYDGSLDPDVLWAVFDIIDDWYGDEHSNIRRVLFSDMVNAVHQAGNLMYAMDHSNPSGCPLTALLNSVYQLIAIKYTLLEMGVTLQEIVKYVRMIVYGDDNIMSVVGGSNLVDLEKLTNALHEKLGLTMTSADKTGPPVYTTLEHVDFLGRSFRFEDGHCYAPRPWENLSLVFNWHKSEEPWESIAQAYSECCFFELSHFTRAEFAEKAARVRRLYDEHGFTCAPLYSIDYYRQNFRKWAGSGRDTLLCWGI